MVPSDMDKLERDMALLIPDVEVRKLHLSVFLESLIEANTYGANKWGVYYISDADRLRLLVGSIIVMTLQKYGIWMALDQELLQSSKAEQGFLNLSEDWHWDTNDYPEYTRIPSKNGYYTPSPSQDSLQIWSEIRQFHFAYIGKVATKFSQLREDSQRKHMPQVLAYLRQELGQYVPEPIYGDALLSPPDSLQEIQEYQSTPQYRNLSETERKSIILSRIGQGQFRAQLIRYWGKCAVTNCQRIEILRASHIKPWRESNNAERLDVYNGLLLIPNLDVAFDSGFITFADDGKILISDSLGDKDRLKLGINPDLRISGITQKHFEFLEYHRDNVFKKNRPDMATKKVSNA